MSNAKPPAIWKSILAGSVSGSLSVLVCHPMDVIRTQIQTSSYSQLSVLKYITQSPVSSLYRGLAPPLFAQALYKAVLFGSNNISKKLLPASSNRYLAILNIYISGCIAGGCVSFVVAPVELIRTLQIVNTESSVANIARSFITRDKILKLWTNLIPTMIRDCPGVGFYFLTYEAVKKSLCETFCSQESFVPMIYRIIAASCAGISFWIWALPFDGIKTTYEAYHLENSNRPSYLTLTNKLWMNGSIRRFYQAWPIAFARGIPSATVTLVTYDIMIDRL